MSIPPRDTSKSCTVTRSQATKNQSWVKEVEESSQVPLKPKRKTQEGNLQYSESSSNIDQIDLLDISIGSISDPETGTLNKSIIDTKNPKSPFVDHLKTFIKRNNSIIIAGDEYNDTPQINQSFDDTAGDITLREKSMFESITENSSMYDWTLYLNQSGDISNDKIFISPQKRYESMDPFAKKSQLNRTPEYLNQTNDIR